MSQMNKKSNRIVLIHGWSDHPDYGWMGWLSRQAEDMGFCFIAPQMPAPTVPNIESWLATAIKAIGTLEDNPILIGHSLGTNILIRYLAKYRGAESEQAKALILVSGFLEPGRKDAEKFFPPILNIEKVAMRAQKIFNIYSVDDKLVKPIKSIELAEQIGGEKIRLSGYGHFLNKQTPQIPELLLIIKQLN